jgi:hypothetical protein
MSRICASVRAGLPPLGGISTPASLSGWVAGRPCFTKSKQFLIGMSWRRTQSAPGNGPDWECPEHPGRGRRSSFAYRAVRPASGSPAETAAASVSGAAGALAPPVSPLPPQAAKISIKTGKSINFFHIIFLSPRCKWDARRDALKRSGQAVTREESISRITFHASRQFVNDYGPGHGHDHHDCGVFGTSYWPHCRIWLRPAGCRNPSGHHHRPPPQPPRPGRQRLPGRNPWG